MIPLTVQNTLNPLRGGHQAGLFSRKINPGLVPDAEVAGVVSQAVDSQAQAHVVEEHVARLQDGFVKVRDAMGFFAFLGVVDPAVILPAEEVGIAGAESLEAFRRNMVFQHRRGSHNFEDGAGSELRLNGAIQQRLLGILVESFPFVGGNTNGEIVGVHGGMAHHGQNFAVARIECNNCAGARAERLLGHEL